MTNASQGVAVIATQVAQTDRRALSEAWYSALHLAREAAPGRPAARAATLTAGAVTTAHTIPLAAAQREPATTGLPVRARREASARTGEPFDRRRLPSETARRIERAVAALSARRPVPAAHTVDVAGGRVRLLVHNDGCAMRIVALCSSPLREHVERALASARFALAGAGIAVAAP